MKDVGGRIGMESSGKDSDHRIGIAAQQDRLANQRWVASETGSPEIVAHDGGLRTVGLILLRQEGAAEGGRDAEDLEIFGRDVDALDLLRAVARAEVQAGPGEVIESHGLEGLVGLFPRHELGDGDVLTAVACPLKPRSMRMMRSDCG